MAKKQKKRLYYEIKTKNVKELKRLKTLRAKRYVEAWSYILNVVSSGLIRDKKIRKPLYPGISIGGGEHPICFIRNVKNNVVFFLNYHKLIKDFPIETLTNIHYADEHLMILIFEICEAVMLRKPKLYYYIRNEIAANWNDLRRMKRVMTLLGKDRYSLLDTMKLELPIDFQYESDFEQITVQQLVRRRVKTKGEEDGHNEEESEDWGQ